VTPYSAEAWAYGGIPRIVGSLARGLARRGHDVTVCATDAFEESSRLPKRAAGCSRLRAWPAARTADHVDLCVFPNVSNYLAYHLQLFLPLGFHHYLSEHAKTFDVAHLHACRNVPGALAAYHFRRSGVPYLLAPNGTAPLLERRTFAKGAFDLAVGRRMLTGAARLLAVSRAEERQLGALGIGPAAIRTIPNPIDLGEFIPPPVRGTFRRRFSLPEASTAPLVMFLGKLTPRKRVDALIRAFARLDRPAARLVIAGNDMGTGRDARALVAALGLEPRTLFTGLLRGRERLEALADADVVVYPSEHEIFGLVPLEALLCASPVVVSDDSGCGEMVTAVGGGQTTPPGDVDALVRAIRAVLDAPSAWRSAATAAAERVRATCGEDVVSARLEAVYAEMRPPA
jgi:glycosyltransferase involved in cell wall biosynthesis